MLKKNSSRSLTLITIFAIIFGLIISWEYFGNNISAKVNNKPNYQLSRDIVYHRINNSQLKLDLVLESFGDGNRHPKLSAIKTKILVYILH